MVDSNHTNYNDIDEDDMFGSILKSMGISNWDPDTIIALSEYTKRLTAEILCDAKDYASHANREDINLQDITLAVKLSDSLISRLDNRTRLLHESSNSVNYRNLLLSLPKHPIDDIYISELSNRTFTYTTGEDAYGEENINQVDMDVDNK